MERLRHGWRLDTPQATDAADYQWLRELRDWLTPVLEVVAVDGRLPLPAQNGELPRRVRLLLEDSARPLAPAIQRAAESSQLEFVSMEGLLIALFPLPGDPMRGTLLVADSTDEGSEAEQRDHLRRIVNLIAQGTLHSSDAATAYDWRELGVLQRLLSQAAAAGSEREVVRTFVEALAVWNDLDVRAYLADFSGRSILDVSLPRADASRAPHVLNHVSFDAMGSVRMRPNESARLGFKGAENVLLLRVDEGRTSRWTLAIIGTVNSQKAARLAIYAEILRAWLRAAAEIESSRLIWAMMQRLIADTESIERAIFAAAGELSQVSISTVVITVDRRDGVAVLRVGGTDESEADATVSSPVRMVFPLPLSRAFSGSLIMLRPPDSPFTMREQRLGEVAASLLASWLGAALVTQLPARERRALSGNFDQLIDTRAVRATEAGLDASLLVFRFDADDQPVTVTQTWVGEIRRRLRPFDVAGTLTTGEIAVLLPDTPEDRAVRVADRLVQSFHREGADPSDRVVSIGIAWTGSAGSASLVDEARQRAAAAGPRL